VNVFGVEPLQMFSDDFKEGVIGFEPVGIVVRVIVSPVDLSNAVS
jgi:hypothetical protein